MKNARALPVVEHRADSLPATSKLATKRRHSRNVASKSTRRLSIQVCSTLLTRLVPNSIQNEETEARLAWREALEVLHAVREAGGSVPDQLLHNVVEALRLSYQESSDTEGLVWLDQYSTDIVPATDEQ